MSIFMHLRLFELTINLPNSSLGLGNLVSKPSHPLELRALTMVARPPLLDGVLAYLAKTPLKILESFVVDIFPPFPFGLTHSRHYGSMITVLGSGAR